MTERGSATVPAVAILAILILAGAGLGGVGRLVAAHAQATAAADAAALAAAPLTFLGGDVAAEAARYAELNGARLVACQCSRDGSFASRTVTVEVSKAVELPVFGSVVVRGRAAAEFAPLDLLGP